MTDGQTQEVAVVEEGVVPQAGDTVLFNRPAKGGQGYVTRKGQVKSVDAGFAVVTESAEDVNGTEVPLAAIIPLYRMVPQPPPMVKTALQNARVLRNVDKYVG